jgi:hypothetical protein
LLPEGKDDVMAILTVRAVEAAKPGRTRNEIPDGTGTGLYLAIEPTGTKSWILRCRHAGVSKRITLGRAGADGLTLVAARHAAAAARHRLEQGADPIAPRQTDSGSPKMSDRIEAAVASFLELHAYRKNRANHLSGRRTHLQPPCTADVAWPIDPGHQASGYHRPG